MAKELEKHISTWLMRLKAQTREGKERVTSRALTDMARMLAADFPSGAFTAESLHGVAVAAPDGWFPSAYAVMNRLVAKWWQDNRPRDAEAPEAVGLTGMDLHWFKYWHRRKREIQAGGPDVWAGRQTAGEALRNLASLVREKSWPAWRAVSGSDGGRAEPSDAEREAAQRSLADVSAALQPRGLFEPPASTPVAEQLRAFSDMPPLTPRPVRGALTAEQLAAARANLAGGAASS